MHLGNQLVLALYTIFQLQCTTLAHRDLPPRHLNLRRATTAQSYAPSKVPCPSQPLIRPAAGLSSQESAYIAAKKPRADSTLRTWLTSLSANFSTNSTLPSLALVGSGGGLRSASHFAGFTQALDQRDGKTGVSGLYGALMYQAALSGGAWYLLAQAAQDWATISYLQSTIFEPNFNDGILEPDSESSWLSYIQTGIDYTDIILDVAEKLAAGYPVTAADVYARLVSYLLFNGTDGGVGNTLSGLTLRANFANHSVPYPILTSIGVPPGTCQVPAPLNSTTYEYSPHEFGSWDTGVQAFVNTTYLGTDFVDTMPVGGECTQGFDNLGFVTGSTSNVLPILCSVSLPTGSSGLIAIENTTLELLDKVIESPNETEVLYNQIPNPFFGYGNSPLVANETQLSLADGGLTDNELALYPMLRPERDIDVVIGRLTIPSPLHQKSHTLLTSRHLVADTAGDNATTHYSNGYSLTANYNMSLASNLTKMPYIPPLSTFAADNVTMQTQFFGCDEPNAITIIWIPLVSWASPNCCNLSTFDLEHSYTTTETLIRNGGLMATQGGDAEWPVCLGCAMMKKASPGDLPGVCEECFARYCYRHGIGISL